MFPSRPHEADVSPWHPLTFYSYFLHRVVLHIEGVPWHRGLVIVISRHYVSSDCGKHGTVEASFSHGWHLRQTKDSMLSAKTDRSDKRRGRNGKESRVSSSFYSCFWVRDRKCGRRSSLIWDFLPRKYSCVLDMAVLFLRCTRHKESFSVPVISDANW